MATHGRSLETKASPETVWKIWSDPDTWSSWNPDVIEAHVDGPFQAGSAGHMRTKRGGSHAIQLEQVEFGKAFQLETAAMAGAKFHFRCEIVPLGTGGSRISQSVTMRGGLAPLLSPMMGDKIAESFVPILEGLARKAEASA